MTGHLVPEQRMNVKGHLVIKHVRAGEQVPSGPAKNIPAPVAVHEESVQAPLLQAVLKKVFRGVKLQDLDREAVPLVEDLLERAGTAGNSSRFVLDEEMETAADRYREGREHGRCYLNNLAFFGRHTVRDDNSRSQNYVNGFKHQQEFAGVRDFLTQGTEEQRTQALALVQFISSFGEGYHTMQFINYGRDDDDDSYEVDEDRRKVYIKDEGLRQLVMDHPDRVDDITGIMQRDYVTDAGTLREIIEHDQQALRDGVL